MRIETILRAGVLLLLPSVWAIEASAQTSVNEKRPAAADGTIGIEIPNGTVTVTGWAQNELQVSGTVTPPDAQLKLAGDARNLQVTLPSQPDKNVSADLKVRVPAGAAVRIQGLRTSIRASGLTGTVTAESLEGDIVVSDVSTVELQTVKGKVDLSGSVRRAKIRAVDGGVSVKTGGGEISVASVGGPIVVAGDAYDQVSLATVKGQVEFEGRLGASARLNAESVSGTVKITLVGGTGADVAVTTMGGKIENGLVATNTADASHDTRRALAFSTGGGGAKIAIQTLDGAVILAKR